MLSSNNKFVVEEIAMSTEQKQELDKIVKRKVSDKNKSRIIRAAIGGTCSCYGIPSIKVSYDVGEDFKFVDYYCSTCYEKNKSKLHLRLQNMNFT